MKADAAQPHASPHPLPEQLKAWTRAGLITREQSAAIGEFEASQHSGSAGHGDAETRGPSLVVEALGYLGGVVMAAGGGVLASVYWSGLGTPARLALLGGTAVALIGAGLAAPNRLGEAAGRLRSVLWAASVAISGGFFAVMSTDVFDRVDESSLIIVFPATAAVAAALWWRHPTWLQQLALVVPALLSGTAVGLELFGADGSAPGAATWVAGLALTTLAWTGWFKPRATGVMLSALGAVFGAMTIATDVGIALAVATGAALVGLAIYERSLGWLGAGALAMLWTLPRATIEWFPGRLSASLSLLVTGGLLVAASLWVARRRSQRRDPTS